MAGRGDCIPIPPLTLWGGVAGYTLVATAAGAKGIKGVEHVPVPGGAYACVYTGLSPGDAANSIAQAILDDPAIYSVRRDAVDRIKEALSKSLEWKGGKSGVPEPLLRELAAGRAKPSPEVALALEKAGITGLLEPLPITRAVVIGFTMHDIKSSGYLSQLASKLCIGKDLSDLTVVDLVEAVVKALRGECDKAWDPIPSLTLFRAEYYKYVRLYMPRPTGKLEARHHVQIPAVAQAIGLLGHIYTSIYGNRRENVARHLASPVPPGTSPREIARAARVFVAARSLLRWAWRQWSQKLGGLPWSVASMAVGTLLWESGARDEYLEEVVVSGGNTISVNEVVQIPGQPVARLLSAIGDERIGECTRIVPKDYKPLLVEGFEKGFSKAVAAGIVRSLPSRGERDLDLEAKRAMIEYSTLLVQYAFSYVEGRPQAELAYAAARAAMMYYTSLAEALAGGAGHPWWLRVLACTAARAVEVEARYVA